MDIKYFIKTKWQYIFVFVMPWIMILVHSLIRDTWPICGDSILYGDTGKLYINLYSELWDKVHSGGSLGFSWSAGLGTELLVGIFTYLMSPFTLLVLVLPKAWLADVVQVIMILKWSLLPVTMLYYISHTRHNKLKERRKLIPIMLVMAYFLSNMMLSIMHNLAVLDTMILFPLLLLMVERVAEGKNIRSFYIIYVLSILVNYRLAIPISIFMLGWFVLQFDAEVVVKKKTILVFCVAYLSAIMTSMIVVLPGMMSAIDAYDTKESMILSLTSFVQRFFVCDTLLLAQAQQPMLYCSVVVAILALLYIFTKIPVKKKLGMLALFSLLFLGLVTRTGNSIWNGMLRNSSEFAFLFVFFVIFVTMETIANLPMLKMWQCFIAGIVSVGGIIYGFFGATLLLDFYVYLSTFLIAIFIVLMLVFYCKKSIQYRNVLVVFAIVCMIELVANAYYQLRIYNEYTIEEMNYHKNAENLSLKLSLEAGEKVAMTQIMYNYGMKLQLPNASQEHTVTGKQIGDLYQALGMEWSSEGSAYFGASPLLNTMFNVRYGMSQNEMAFSDSEEIKSNDDYNLYEMKRLAGLGYMVDEQVREWNTDMISPFEVQNDFVKKSTGKDAIFEILKPQASCFSVTGSDPTPDAEHHHDHEHAEGEVCEYDEEAVYYGEYLENSMYYYRFYKMYSEDMVSFSFESDGVSDYYVYLKCANPSNTYVQIGEEYVYWDQFVSEQKTLHVGIIPEGESITVISNFAIDDVVLSEVWYQVASFKEDAYSAAYDELSADTLQILSYKEDYVEGEILVERDGVMLTSIAANQGLNVLVDGSAVEWERIGGALVGIPLSKGNHNIVIEYKVPYLLEGVLLSLGGIVVFVLGYVLYFRKREEV